MKQFLLEAQYADEMRQEFEQELPHRIKRYLEMGSTFIVPNHHFASVEAECKLLFRDGYFYGCIALVQGVAEAISRFLCQKNSFKAAKGFENRVEKLCIRGFISNRAEQHFIKIWENRNDYHHLNPDIERDRKKTEKLAKDKIQRLGRIESEIFGYNICHGKIVPHKPKYWEKCDDKAFMQIGPPRRWQFKHKKS